jgi:hypothetical protein
MSHLLICFIMGLLGLMIICIALRALKNSDVETIKLADGTMLKFNRCQCGKSKGLNQTMCYECETMDRCECGELKSKEGSFCSRCRLELKTEGRISRKPLLPY